MFVHERASININSNDRSIKPDFSIVELAKEIYRDSKYQSDIKRGINPSNGNLQESESKNAFFTIIRKKWWTWREFHRNPN